MKTVKPSDYYFTLSTTIADKNPKFALRCHADVEKTTDYLSYGDFFDNLVASCRKDHLREDLLALGFIENDDIVNLKFVSYY